MSDIGVAGLWLLCPASPLPLALSFGAAGSKRAATAKLFWGCCSGDASNIGHTLALLCPRPPPGFLGCLRSIFLSCSQEWR